MCMKLKLFFTYRKNGINSRTCLRAALSNKEQFLLSKFWALFSKKLIRAAAINSVYTVNGNRYPCNSTYQK